MAGSRLLKGIHIVGYVTTVIVLIELAGVGYLSWSSWSRSEQIRARIQESTRTHDRALGAVGIPEADAAKSYRPVRPPPDASSDVLGFVFMPSFSGWHAASIQLPTGATVAHGAIVFVQHSDQTRRLTPSQVETFTVPRADYLAAARQIDSLTDGWPGSSDEDCFDGTLVAFERVKAGRVTSGTGNASCDAHYAALTQIMEPLLKRFGPAAPAPPSGTDDGSSAPASDIPSLKPGLAPSPS